jgi:GRAM domain
MSSFFKVFCQTSLAFGLAMSLVFSLMNGWKLGIPMGLASGILFGIAITVFVSYQAKKFTKNRPLFPDENLVKEGGANHFLNGEAVGGWIYLSDSRFFFKSHNSNIQNHEFIISLSEIAEVENSKTFGIISNGLKLTLNNQSVEKFVVNDSKNWTRIIKGLI